MIFNSLVFALFLAIVYPVWRVLRRLGASGDGRLARRWLLAASLFFYGWWDPRFLALLLGTCVVDWACARGIEASPSHKRAWLGLSLASNLLVLGTFKYLGFFVTELDAALGLLGVHGALPVLQITLPVGLSFYTFQAMAYTVDVYRGHVKACRNLLDFLLFVSFFPQLVAGPIERSGDLLPQLVSPRPLSRSAMAEGAWLMVWGYLKKVLVADNLAPIVAHGFDDPRATGVGIVVAAYAFTWQIYCDFSGYSDIARGVARMFGVELSMNFDLPFFATSPRDIWRRWHMTLSRWLRDYVYIPLGGGHRRPTLNLLITMLLGGLWHGASWTFIAWGAWHGIAMALQRRFPIQLPRPLAIVLTFHLLVAGFVLFRAHSLTQVVDLARIVGAWRYLPGDLGSARVLATLCAPVLLAEWVMWRTGDPFVALRLPRPVQAAVVVAGVFAMVTIGSSYGAHFIYFQF